jgi:hypothetical protein
VFLVVLKTFSRRLKLIRFSSGNSTNTITFLRKWRIKAEREGKR